jgi:multiple sugar transport system substrate-binding protein
MRSGAGSAAVAAVAACRPGAPGGGEVSIRPGGSGRQVTLKVGARANGAPGNPSTEEFLEAKRVFEEKYPQITIEFGWSMNAEKFLAAAAAGDAWDIQDTCCDQIPVEARAGVLMKLDPLIKRGMRPDDVKDWIEWQYKYFNIDGSQYGIGKYMGTTALYYNKDWFQQKGVSLPDETWDWNKYRDAMIRLTDAPNKKWGISLLSGSGQPMNPDRRQAKVHQNGGYFVDSRNDLKSGLDHPRTIEAFEWIHARIWKDNASIQPDQRPGVPDAPMDARRMFTGGVTAMWEDGSWSLVPVLQDEPSFEWDVVTLPKGPVQRDVLATTDGWAMWAHTRSIDDAWLLFSWFNGDDWYAIQSRRLQPARLSWQSKWMTMITEANPKLKGKNLKAFTMAAEQGFARPWMIHRYHAAVDKLIRDEYDASVTFNRKPVKDTHVELARLVNEIQAKEHAQRGGK